MIKIAEPGGMDYAAFLRLYSDYDRNHRSRWIPRPPLEKHEIRQLCSHYLDELVVMLHVVDCASGFTVTGEKDMFIDGSSIHVGYIYHIFSKIRGGGTEMVEEAEKYHKERGVRTMGLHVVINNESVLPFFQKKGFRIAKRRGIVAMLKDIRD